LPRPPPPPSQRASTRRCSTFRPSWTEDRLLRAPGAQRPRAVVR